MSKPVVWKVELDQATTDMSFHCPGCDYGHSFRIKGLNPWQWNGDEHKPTFTPSLLVNKHDPAERCHLFVRNGLIQYLSDCHHEMRGQTVTMEPLEEEPSPWNPRRWTGFDLP